MKRLISIFLVLATVLTLTAAIPVSAEEETAELSETYGVLTYEINVDNTIRITDCDRSATEVTIPAEIDGRSVTSIGRYAFSGCSSLANVTISDSVVSIERDAFQDTAYYNNENNWQDGVLYIGRWLIAAKSNILSCTIKSGTIGIAGFAFYDCSSLTSVTIPNGVISIGESAFDSCSSLTNITVPDSVIYVGFRAFYHTKWMNGQPDGPVYIGDILCGTNGYYEGDMIIKEGTRVIAEYAFGSPYTEDSQCGAERVIMPDSITYIGRAAFSYCSDLKSVVLSTNIKTIERGTFSGCSSLESITIPDGVTNISYSAFAFCSSLKSITIPGRVISIGEGAFGYCRSLTDVYYTGTESQWNKIAIDDSYNEYLFSANIHFANDDADVKIGGAVEDKSNRKISADFQNASGAAKTFDAICAVYDERGALITYEDVTVTVASGETRKIEFLLSSSDWDSYRLFAWDELGSMRPLASGET